MGRRLIAIFLLSAAGLLLQVSMTRILSLIAWHHFAYLIISLALLGIGAAGSYLTFSRRLWEAPDRNPWIGRYAWLFSLSTIGCLVLMTRIKFAPVDIYLHGDWSQLYGLALIELAVAVPYFFAGVAMGAILSTAGGRIGGIYFSDMAGAALGSLLALLLINELGGLASIFASAVVSGAAACVLAGGAERRLPRPYLLTLGAALALTGLGSAFDVIPIRFPPSKALFRNEHMIETTRWDAIARVDVLKPERGFSPLAAGIAPNFPRQPLSIRQVLQDGAAPTTIVNPAGPLQNPSILGYYLQGLAYVAYEEPRVLVIGVGGGADVLLALHHGARSVVGVEVHPAMVELLHTKYADFSGRLAFRPEVELRVAEGRHFLTADPRTFDVIQLTGVDTFTALSSGAYALTENYLYTIEAMHDLLDHLRPGGVVSIARWLFDPPRETLRLVTTQLAALEQRGLEDASEHLLIVKGPQLGPTSEGFPWAETLLKNEPFSRDEVDRYRQWVRQRRFEVVYDPFVPRRSVFDQLIRSDPQRRRSLVEAYVYDVGPSTDDNPFFFQFYRWRNLFAGDFLKPELVTGAAIL